MDADLVKFEEDQTVGDSRITTLPGLQPSARSLKEGADVRERATKRLERERKDPKGEKKSKCAYHKRKFVTIKLIQVVVVVKSRTIYLSIHRFAHMTNAFF